MPGPPLDFEEFREAARKLSIRRAEAVRDFEEQVRIAAEAEASYQGTKTARIARMKAAGVGVTEALQTSKGEADVRRALIEREVEAGKLKARQFDIDAIDAQRSSLHRLADWSLRLGLD